MKTKTNHWTIYEIEFIEEHLNEMTNKEIALALGIEKQRVHSITQYYGIKRTAKGKEHLNKVRGESLEWRFAQERERVKQGLPQLTKFKLNKKFLAQYGNA